MTTIQLRDAAIGEGRGAAVPALTATIAHGAPTVLAVETEERPLLVSMLIGGRVRADSGSVTIDGADDANELRRRTALVDTPFVAEPAATTPLSIVVAEELSFAGRPSGRAAVSAFLGRHGLTDWQRLEVGVLPPEHRVRIFSELALLRDGVDTLVVTSPERHGGDQARWFAYLASVVERDTTVVIVTDAVTRDHLVSLGAVDALSESESTLP